MDSWDIIEFRCLKPIPSGVGYRQRSPTGLDSFPKICDTEIVQGRKAFKYRIQASSQTIDHAERWLSLCRNLYNAALEQRITAWRGNCHPVSAFDQKKELPEIKRAFPEYNEVGSQVLQDVIERLDKAYQGFFRRLNNGNGKAGFPRFKGRNRYDSFTLKQAGWKLDGKYLSIHNVGRFKLRLSRPIEGNIKTVTIRRASTGKWFATFSCDDVPLKPLPPTGRAVGIDVGLESFLTTSEGMKIGNPRFLNRSRNILAMRQQRFSRKVKGSHRRQKARILVAKAHEKITNQRRDFHFKIANQLVGYYDTICIEKMDSWNSTTALNRSMRDAAWFGFFEILRWKAEEAARTVIEVPAKDTSQLCSQCGARVPKDLSVRIHSCPSCGLSIDRDINAALNILRLGQSRQEFPAQALRIPCL
jgi:putative transposase